MRLCLARAMAGAAGIRKAGVQRRQLLRAIGMAAGFARLTGTFGKTEIAVPRARLNISGGKTTDGRARYCGIISAAPRRSMSGRNSLFLPRPRAIIAVSQ